MKAMAILAMTTLMAGTAAAHPHGEDGRMGPGGPPMERLTERLGLDAYQAQQVETILGEARTKGMDIMLSLRDEARDQMEGVHAETIEALSGVLSADQLAEFEALSQRFRERRFGGPRGRFGPRHGHDRDPADDSDAT